MQKFCVQGRFIFGPDVRSLFMTIFLIVAPVAVFCVFVARKLVDDFAGHWGWSIMVVAVVFTVYVSAYIFLSVTKLIFCKHDFKYFRVILAVLAGGIKASIVPFDHFQIMEFYK